MDEGFENIRLKWVYIIIETLIGMLMWDKFAHI